MSPPDLQQPVLISLLGGGFVAAFLHAALPTHWLPFVALAVLLPVALRTAPGRRSLLTLADTFVPGGVVEAGLDLRRLGLQGLDRDGVLAHVRTEVTA